ncbi:hypothetical protein [Brevundimonas goettingensis]|uniref:Conjugal transfer protein TraN n=1 Tax=Brevundimonas goettingensis TaxID=2774190 RepID=A0A975C0D5_9CAUL|nr:hypothetical protein [Brevundimonas goettingensis]QTC90004.1 hypothetical protein IFJ75_11955 [Brevundimonas goettingensis]
MFKTVLSALGGIMSAALVLAVAPAASAQSERGVGPASNGDLARGVRSMSAALVDPRSSPVTQVLPSRLDRQRNRNGVYTQQPTPNQILSTSQSQINTANVECRVVDAALLGYNADQQGVYEVSCGSGMGYVVAAASPPTVTDCVTLASRAESIRAQDPAAPAALVCKLVGNSNIAHMVATYGQQAGVTCAVDQAAMVGTSVAGNAVYEIGCPGAEGYWIEKTTAGWTTTPCIKVAATGTSCRFTTGEESAVSARAWLVNTPASACDVTDVRYMGANAAGAFYETRCGAGGGFVARLDNSMAVQQVYPCAEAASIGGGCKLTAAVDPRP